MCKNGNIWTLCDKLATVAVIAGAVAMIMLVIKIVKEII